MPGLLSQGPSAVPAAPSSAKERDCQEAAPRLVSDFQFNIACIGQLIPEFFDRGQSLGTGRFNVREFDPLLVFINVIAVSDIEEIARHESSALELGLGKRTPLGTASSIYPLCAFRTLPIFSYARSCG
jgi:hypothetical protein